ncbi:MAG: SRPBCC family protein [Kofleriaceae bacterium]
MYELERHQRVAAPRAQVFAFFADAANLQQMTPPELGFEILTPQPIDMRAGARIAYRITLHHVPMTWQTLIEDYQPSDRFVDVQLAGPYKVWHHTHTFEDAPGGGTVLGDHVRYALPFGPLGKVAHALFVKRQLQRIFDHRARVMRDLFGVSDSIASVG